MSQTIVARTQLRDDIAEDIRRRTEAHQQRVQNLNIGRRNLAAVRAPAQTQPLVMLAHGDSWFDYPLDGNVISLGTTDIIAQLTTMGTINPIILNVSHFGDATTDELSLPKQKRLIAALTDDRNWPNEKRLPDAILFSGGGNDVAGDRFCIFLDFAKPGSSGLDDVRFRGVLDAVQASLLDLFAFRDRHAPGVPIFAHDYDFPIPNGAHPPCAGPWLKPSLIFMGWNNLEEGTAIVREALLQFSTMLRNLAADRANNFTLVPTQSTLKREDWANELHPYPAGFRKLAAEFIRVLAAHSGFRDRI